MSDSAPPRDTRSPITRPASEIPSQTVEWLWSGRVPRGKLTILAGDPDKGKTTVALDLSARISSGRLAPGDDGPVPEPADVIFVSVEDGAGDTLRPRLEAAGADLGRVHVFVRVVPLAIPEEIDVLRAEIVRCRASLLVLDPLSAILSVVNTFRVGDVRRGLAPVTAMAEATGAAVLAIEHLNKDATKAAIYRTQGSIGFVGAARSVLVVGLDPDDKDRRILARAKCNLAPPVPSLAYRIVAKGEVAGIEWLGISPHSADRILAPPTRSQGRAVADAEEYLREALAKGAAPAMEVEARAKALSIALPTVQRAKQLLEIRSVRRGDEWWWRWFDCMSLPLVAESLPAARCDDSAHAACDGATAPSCAPWAPLAVHAVSLAVCSPGGDA